MATDFYVAPNGSPSGNGSMSAPWDLRTALNQPSAVKPGDTIWLRGGTYTGLYTSYLAGATGAPVILRQYAGEHAVIDGGCDGSGDVLNVQGHDAWYWGFEIMSSCTATRLGGATTRPLAVELFGHDIKMINLMVHDINGYSPWSSLNNIDTEVYGNIIFNDGYDGGSGDRGHGHGLYIQNQYGQKHITDNIIFNNFGHGIQIYGTSGSAYADNVILEGNTSFDSGMIAYVSAQPAADMIIGTLSNVIKGLVLNNNMTYYPVAMSDNRGITVKYDGALSPVVQNNYVACEQCIAMELGYSGTPIVAGNSFYGSVSGVSSSAFPSNTYYTSRPTGLKVFVRPNKYESGRANITIYNWDGNSSVPVDLSGIGLAVGDAYEIHNAQNMREMITGVYGGSPVSVPMTGWTAVKAMGWDYLPPSTFPTFGVFVVMRPSGATGQQSPPQQVATPVISPNGGQFSGSQAVSITCATAGSKILYSIDGSTPSLPYTGPIVLTASATVQAKATAANMLDSSVASAAFAISAPAIPGTILINSGGSAYTDPQGSTWAADNAFSGGTSYSTASAIANTNSSPLYQTVRYGNFGYNALVANGNYTVVLKFAEIYWTSTGKRVFNAAINGQTVLSNFDIVAQAGGALKAIDKQFPVSVTNNQINIQFTTLADNACVSAIAILPASSTPVSVSVSPATTSLSASQTQQFTATVANTTNTAVTWSLNPATGAGTVSSTGLYTAPATIASTQTVTITATSAADPTKSASATITLNPTVTTSFNPIRVNAGGGSYTDPLGQVWSADTNYNGGATYYSGMTVRGTTTPVLYQTVRYLPLTYTFNVPNGTHTVNLKFGEIYFSSPGQRVFNVLINGQTVLANFDIVGQAGAGVALDKQFTVNVTNGQISIQLTPVIENPMISAIEIL